MRENNHKLLEQYNKLVTSTKPVSVTYVYEIFLSDARVLHLTSASSELLINQQRFTSYSSLHFIKGEFNDSADNVLILTGIFENGGITKNMNLAGCKIKIYSYLDGDLSLLVSYFITEFEKNDLDFVLKCKPETDKYNQSLLLLFSRTCRANFGDHKCGVNLDTYKRTYGISSISGRVVFVNGINTINGYYTSGQATFTDPQGRSFSYKITSHYNDRIELQENIAEDLLTQVRLSLAPTCDKTFRTCCNKFNNAVNFRGEATIPEYNFLKSNVE